MKAIFPSKSALVSLLLAAVNFFYEVFAPDQTKVIEAKGPDEEEQEEDPDTPFEPTYN